MKISLYTKIYTSVILTNLVCSRCMRQFDCNKNFNANMPYFICLVCKENKIYNISIVQ